MGSLFYNDIPTEKGAWEPREADYATALDQVARRVQHTAPAATLGSYERAEELRREAERLEAELLPKLADGSVKPVDAVARVRAGAPAWFPAEKFVEILETNAGGRTKLPDAARVVVGNTAVPIDVGKGEVR